MSIRVGEVIAVHGTKVVLKIDEKSSKETLFYKGDKYKGVSIREYLSIQRGFRDIICMVEGEYLDQGCCVVTGTAFELPMVIQIDRLPTGRQPDSEDVDLDKLWCQPEAAD